ncbi:MAG: thiamine diphosphokinase, partial [Acetobacteraceae bacterium]|nr:thiamine diphosphokinase [Acetobacteraceae bacterium]
RLRPDFLRSVVQPDDFLICADGGRRCAARADLTPELVIGDLDSCPAAPEAARPGASAAAGAAGRAGAQTIAQTVAPTAIPAPRVVRYPCDKDFTDLELALEHALAAGFREILIVGAVGGRLDHTLTNVHLLLRAARAGAFACLAFPGGRLWTLVGPARHRLEGRPEDIVSLIPLSPEATGVRTEGLKYPLRGETLRWDQGRGVSNRLVAGEAEVSLDRGALAVVHLERGRRGRAAPALPGRGGVEPPENGGAGVPGHGAGPLGP